MRARSDPAGSSPRDDALEQLYAVEPEQFVAERKRLERELRAAGHTDEAAEIAGRRKPTLPVFAANRLARTRRDDVTRLIDAAEQIAAAHEAGDRERLRRAQAELAERVRELGRDAGPATGRSLSDEAEQRLASLLRAAVVDPELRPLLRNGTLSDEAEPAGFDALAGLSLPPPTASAATGEQAKPARRDAARKEKLDRLEDDLADARDALRAAERELTAAERQADRARKRVEELEARLERARAV